MLKKVNIHTGTHLQWQHTPDNGRAQQLQTTLGHLSTLLRNTLKSCTCLVYQLYTFIVYSYYTAIYLLLSYNTKQYLPGYIFTLYLVTYTCNCSLTLGAWGSPVLALTALVTVLKISCRSFGRSSMFPPIDSRGL